MGRYVDVVYLMGSHLTCNIIMIMLTCGFGVGVTPMVWSLVGDALNRYVQALCMCIIFTFVDEFFGAGSLQHATDAHEDVHNAIRGTLGYDGLSVKKNVSAQTAEILGFHVDFPTGRVRPKDGAIEKMFFALGSTADLTVLAVPRITGGHVFAGSPRNVPLHSPNQRHDEQSDRMPRGERDAVGVI